MQDLELNYPTTKGKVCLDEEDPTIYTDSNNAMVEDDEYEGIKKDIAGAPRVLV